MFLGLSLLNVAQVHSCYCMCLNLYEIVQNIVQEFTYNLILIQDDLMQLLTGNALVWSLAMWESCSPVRQDDASFSTKMRKVFDHPVNGVGISLNSFCLFVRVFIV